MRTHKETFYQPVEPEVGISRVVWIVHPESDCVFRGRMQDADELCHPITEAEAHSLVRQGYSASDADREALGLGLGGWEA